MPSPKPPAFEAADLSAHFCLPMQVLAPAFRALGWTSFRRTDQGRARTLWVPPGSHIKPRKRGEASRIYAY